MPNPPLPNDPYPEPVRPSWLPEQTPSDPVNVPVSAPDVILPVDDPMRAPPVPGLDIPPLIEPPMVAQGGAQ